MSRLFLSLPLLGLFDQIRKILLIYQMDNLPCLYNSIKRGIKISKLDWPCIIPRSVRLSNIKLTSTGIVTPSYYAYFTPWF